MAPVLVSAWVYVLLAVAALVSLAYLYVTRHFGYWQRRGVAHSKPVPFLGSLKDMILFKDTIAGCFRKEYERFPAAPLVGMFGFDVPMVVVRDLDLAKRVLVKDARVFLDRSFAPSEDVDPMTSRTLFGLKGSKWRRLRVKLTPTFTPARMKAMFYLVDACGRQLVECIDQEQVTGEPVLVKDMVSRYTIDGIASCAFGLDVNGMADGNNEFRRVIAKIFDLNLATAVGQVLAFFKPSLLKLLRMRSSNSQPADLVRRVLWDEVGHRRRTGVVRGDFVDLLMRIQERGDVGPQSAGDLEETEQDGGPQDADHDVDDIKLEGDDFVAQAFIFLAAGFETSASVLTFTLYELALNPEVQDRLREEIAAVLDRHGGKLSYDVFSQMTYLDMIVSVLETAWWCFTFGDVETLRKYPNLGFLERKSLADYKIPGSDVVLEKGTTVVIPVLAFHNDPNIFPDPQRYDPERFTADNKSKRHSMAYLPFGEGPRKCIGVRFGQTQVKTALVHVLRAFRVRSCPATPEPPVKMKITSLTLTPLQDIPLVFDAVRR